MSPTDRSKAEKKVQRVQSPVIATTQTQLGLWNQSYSSTPSHWAYERMLRWKESGFDSISSNWHRTMSTQLVQHALMRPYAPVECRLLNHAFQDTPDLFVGTYQQHLVIFYPARMLERMPGGVASIFNGINALSRLVSWAPRELGHLKPVHIQNTSAGIEVVLAYRMAVDAA